MKGNYRRRKGGSAGDSFGRGKDADSKEGAKAAEDGSGIRQILNYVPPRKAGDEEGPKR